MDAERPVFRDDSASPPPVPEGGGEPRLDEEPSTEVPGSWLAALPQFFVFPAILVATLLGIYLLLRGLAGAEPDSSSDLMADLRSAGPHARWQVLHSMADGLNRGTLDLAEVPSADLRGMYVNLTATSEDAERGAMQHYLLQILGHKRDPELTPLLLTAAADEDVEVRKSALAALGLAKDPAALELILERLRQGEDDERLLALGALGNLSTPEALDGLATQLEVADSIIARNAALLLAAHGDERAEPFVRFMLDRGSYQGDPALASPLRAQLDEGSRTSVVDAATEQFLVLACKAAADLGSDAAVPALQVLRETDPSLKVKSAALDALHDLGADTES